MAINKKESVTEYNSKFTVHNETEQNVIENPYYGMEDNTPSNMPSNGSVLNTSTVQISENPYYT